MKNIDLKELVDLVDKDHWELPYLIYLMQLYGMGDKVPEVVTKINERAFERIELTFEQFAKRKEVV